ncbi:MAG: hypothetical protein ABW122_01165 [Ilumatobacteraceae bacterium]
MTTTLSPLGPTSTTATTAMTAPPRKLDERRLAAVGALTFAAIVITTNVLQGATPAMDADADEIVTYLTDHRTANILATAAFAVGAPFLLMFASAFYGRLKAVSRSEDLVWARLGMIGALLILPTFAAVVVQRIVLLVGTDEIIGSPELVTLVWRVEMASFVLNTLPMAAAILGFGVAGARSGLLRRWFRRWAPIASAAAVSTAACSVAGLEGSPIGFGGLVPFATWMLLLITAGIRQLRSA